MQKLKKQISESFFNPILYFLPALVFMVVDDFWGINTAWKVSFPFAFALVFYVYFMYKRMFFWHGILAFCYLLVGFFATLVADTIEVLNYTDEFVFFILIVILVSRKKALQKVVSKTLPHEIPMSNNENELFRVARVLMMIVLVYLILGLLFDATNLPNKEIPIRYIKYIYALSIIFVGIFETIRVFIVREKLMREDWLPVVDEEGRVIGSVQYQHDADKKVRLMHPVVRLYFIENRKILLQQRKPDDQNEPMLWDASLSRQVRMSESIDGALRTFTGKLYNIEPIKFFSLTKYIYHGTFSDQLIYLFVLCKSEGIAPQADKIFKTKWWTIKQIEDNLNSGIFTERFIKEYEVLERSGLLERDGCDCECRLRDSIQSMMESSAD
ncbi:MAG: hypothetical protein GX102_07675 [Porphyromonadaceae bacterium]|nr:hypothetical protein [Porphyromonadaceae bacterium]